MGQDLEDALGALSHLVLGGGKHPFPLTQLRRERPQECNDFLTFLYLQFHLLFIHKVDGGLAFLLAHACLGKLFLYHA